MHYTDQTAANKSGYGKQGLLFATTQAFQMLGKHSLHLALNTPC